MVIKFEQLLKIHVEHKYFDGFPFSGYRLSPSKETQSLFLKYGLKVKSQSGSLLVYFENPFEGSNRDRASVLKEQITLQFHLEITDPSFYQYTGNLPHHLSKIIFWFSNFKEDQQVLSTSNLLHLSEFVSESDIKPSPDASHYFGHIAIQFDVDLKEDFYIRFLNKSTHWRYIFVSDHLLDHEQLAVVDVNNQILFSEPEIVTFPNGLKGIAITSAEPIALLQHTNVHFRLVDHYDASTNHFEKEWISKLPDPPLSSNPDMHEIIIHI